jgi:hypothetical protein
LWWILLTNADISQAQFADAAAKAAEADAKTAALAAEAERASLLEQVQTNVSSGLDTITRLTGRRL